MSDEATTERGANGTNRLAAARQRAGLTQRELAERVGLARTTVIRLEMGQTQPRLLTACALGAALGVDPATLFPPEAAGG